MRQICIVTGTRAEYGLLYWTMKSIDKSIDLSLQIIVTGMHLSPEFGLTYKLIEDDGFLINEKVEMLLSSDTSIGITKSMGLAMIGFGEVFSRLKPDIILVLGDRFEIFSAVAAAMIARIPIAHCHGGEATEGLIDESIRHSITKMSQIHFTATEQYRKRVIQLGENPERVFNVGALGIENINKLNLLDKDSFEKSIDFKLSKLNFLVTFHPVTLDFNSAESQFSELLVTLNEYEDAKIIFTKPNSDMDGRIIIQLIDEYVKNNSLKSVSFVSLGQLRYLSAIKNVDIVIGNSSSGIIEVPTLKKPTINIGDRQKGRIYAKSIINCNPNRNEIREAISYALSVPFQNSLKKTTNPYGTGNSSVKIVDALSNFNIENILKKEFYNLNQ